MIDELPYRLLANLVLIVHAALAVFVIAGPILVIAGNLRGWRWVNGWWFRVAHALVIAFAVGQAWLGMICPLTSLEMSLREQGHEATYQGTFTEHWLRYLLYYEAPSWVFTAAYTLFGLFVAFTWWYFPPARGRGTPREA